MSRLLALWIALTCIAAAPPGSFTDPAPPQVHDVTTTTPPPPQPHAQLTFHQPPRPLAANATTEDWPSFLGPRHNNTSAETYLLKEFPKQGPRIVWEVKKGEGYAAPAVLGDRLILFHRTGDEEIVECLHPATGQRYWRHAYPSAYIDRYGYSGGPRCAPVIDVDRVYTYGVEGKLHCLALATGQVLWQRDLLKEFKVDQAFFGVGATPLVEGNFVIVNIGAPNGPSVAAFDKSTGKLAWGAGNEWGGSYASPVPATVHGRRRLFVFAGGESRPPIGGLMSIDAADGRVESTFPWRGDRYESVNASNPLVVGNQVFISECYGAGSALLDILPDGMTRPAWTNEDFGTHFMTAIHKDGFLYGVHGHGPTNSPLVCLDLKTGKELWREEPLFIETVKRGGEERKIKLLLARASLLHADGRFLCLGEYGHLLWLDLTPRGYRELSRAWLFFAGETWTPPVLSKGLLYICQNQPDPATKNPPRLICYDLRSE